MVNYIIIIIFVFFIYFSYHSSCRKDQFTVLTLKFGYSRCYWSISTKDPADPYWFVVVVFIAFTSVNDRWLPTGGGRAWRFYYIRDAFCRPTLEWLQ